MTKPNHPGHRRCPKCNAVKPLSAFGRDRTRATGIRVYCRDCDNAHRKVRWTASYWTPERIAAHQARQAETAARIRAAQSGTLPLPSNRKNTVSDHRP